MNSTRWESHDTTALVEPSVVTLGQYDITWSDGVANMWHETYPTESVALLRLAALARCGEDNWQRWLAVEPEEFTALAAEFLARVTRG